MNKLLILGMCMTLVLMSVPGVFAEISVGGVIADDLDIYNVIGCSSDSFDMWGEDVIQADIINYGGVTDDPVKKIIIGNYAWALETDKIIIDA